MCPSCFGPAVAELVSCWGQVHYIEEQIQRRREAAAQGLNRLEGRQSATCAQSGKDRVGSQNAAAHGKLFDEREREREGL